MVLWVLFALMTAASLLAVLRPLLRQQADVGDMTDGQRLDVYKSQIAEIDTDLARRTLTVDEAAELRAEVARRLLSHHDKTRSEARPGDASLQARSDQSSNGRVAMAALVLVPLSALVIYLSVGSPLLPSQPHASRTIENADGVRVAELVRRVEAQLARKPDDGRGWDVIAPVYMKTGRYDDAAEAFGNANRLLGETQKRLLGFAEATTYSGNGIVSEAAQKAFAKVLSQDPKNVPAAYWLAIAKEQNGDMEGARSDLAGLIERVGPATVVGRSISDTLEVIEAKIKGGSDVVPAPEGKGLSDPDTRNMIEGMVSGLAARLETDKDDFSGWMRLIRSYAVLGRRDDALKALQAASDQFSGKPEQLDALQKLAKDLRITT